MGKICEFFDKKNVLVTGALGYCGKILVEKLLRTSEGIGKIFIIVRQKKSVSPQDRYISYINHIVFNGMRESNSELLKKIIVISGDLGLDKMNLSEADEATLINEVNIVFHCAGNVKFDEPLKVAINNNAIGTWRVLQLAEKMRKCEVFSYMSTAFSKCFREDLDEQFYPSMHDVWDVIQKTQQLDDVQLLDLERELLATSKHPNTYTLSKAFGEDIVESYREKLPVVIIRPSMVWPCVSEPIRGYMEGFNSGLGLISATMTGFVRISYVGETSIIKFTPADYVINATIASAWKRATLPVGELLVYNSSEPEEHSMTWRQLVAVAKDDALSFVPYDKLLWYPSFSLTSNYYWYLINVILFQFIPALLLDLVVIISGRKAVFTSLQKKIFKGSHALNFFVSNMFQFDTTKLKELFTELDEDDQQKFPFNHSALQLKEYFIEGVRQGRRLLLKEDDATIPKGQRKLQKLYYADVFCKSVASALLIYHFTNFASSLI